jgi:CheY-like chemotaxis protein
MSIHSRSGVHQLDRPSVLVVDDDADSAELYAVWLRSAGYRVSIMSDAERALILSPALRPTVAVIDIGLPGIDGMELVRMLRARPELAPCHYIAVTAYADVGLPSRCRSAGFCAYFEKPVARASLVDSVFAATALRQRAQYS